MTEEKKPPSIDELEQGPGAISAPVPPAPAGQMNAQQMMEAIDESLRETPTLRLLHDAAADLKTLPVRDEEGALTVLTSVVAMKRGWAEIRTLQATIEQLMHNLKLAQDQLARLKKLH